MEPRSGGAVGFILKAYPRLSETFILREILLLEKLGHTLHIFAMRRPRERAHEMVERVRARVTYIPDRFLGALGTIVRANLGLWRRDRARYQSALRLAVSRSLRERSPATLKRFLQAGYLVEAGLPGSGVVQLHAHFSHDPTSVAFFASLLSGIPYSFSAHAKDIYTQRDDWLRQKIAGARFVVTCTEFNRAYLQGRATAGTPVLRCYHGVDLEAFPARPRPALDPPHILSVGRLVPKKGFPVLLQALGMLQRLGRAFRCTIVGSGPLAAELEARIASLGLGERVVLRAPMPAGELLELYRSADVFALPCQVEEDGDRDGIPNVLIEAMAMEIPVVSTAVSGIPECVEHGVSGILVPERDPAALARAIEDLLERPERAERLGRAARLRVERDFEANRNVEPIAGALREALQMNGDRPRREAGDGTPRRGEHDRLATLGAALDEERMRSVLAPRAKQRFGDRFEVERIGIKIYRRHGNRCVVHYRVRGRVGDGSGRREWRVIGKVLQPGVGEATFGHMRHLWANGFARDAEDGITMPEPLEYLPELAMLLQEAVGGASVRNLAKQSREEDHFRLLARTLVKLHRCPMPPGRVRGVDDLLQRCHPKHPFLSLAFPDLAPSVDGIVDRAREAERRLGALTPTAVHGDFHLGQVHVEGGRAWLVDFDALGCGDPASDLGNLMVFLKDKGRRDPSMRTMVSAFLGEYFSRMDPAIASRLPLYEALTHLRRACKQLRFQEPGWREKAALMIGRGSAAMDEMEASPALAARGGRR